MSGLSFVPPSNDGDAQKRWHKYLDSTADRWWKEGIIYQIYPRSFQDSNKDGIGDLNGITQRLDYLSWLGIDAIWLNPIMPSPDIDWGYDVSNYIDIHPDFGTLEDFDRLLNAAHAKGIRVILDLVPNHTSDQHPWFQEARSSRSSQFRDWYVWADPKPDGSPPNNWLSHFAGPAWTLDQASGQYYLHNFHPAQPDLNWWNPEVRQAFDEILEFWYARGIDGFRVDVPHGLIHDRLLRDDPISTEKGIRPSQLPRIFSLRRPERHEIFRHWHQLGDQASPPKILIAESWSLDLAEFVSYYGKGDEFNLAFNFWLTMSPFKAELLSQVVARSEQALSTDDGSAYTGSNHDIGRLASRWCQGDERKIRCALVMLLTLRGTPVLYYGDEIGLPDVEVPPSYAHDRVKGTRTNTRDKCRTPMPWLPAEGDGFTDVEVQPWLPIGEHNDQTVAEQYDQKDSLLHFTRALLRLRRQLPELRHGSYQQVYSEQDVWAWRRGEQIVVALNLSEKEATIPKIKGELLFTTRKERTAKMIQAPLSLAPFEGVILKA